MSAFSKATVTGPGAEAWLKQHCGQQCAQGQWADWSLPYAVAQWWCARRIHHL